MLAQYVGPVAGVMVRRAARECADLPALYARLAEGVTNPTARNAFVAHVSMSRPGTAPRKTAVSGAPAAAGAAVIGEALIEQSAKLLARYVGPIAPIVARRAAAAAGGREAFFAALGESVSDAGQRAKLRAELDKLG